MDPKRKKELRELFEKYPLVMADGVCLADPLKECLDEIDALEGDRELLKKRLKEAVRRHDWDLQQENKAYETHKELEDKIAELEGREFVITAHLDRQLRKERRKVEELETGINAKLIQELRDKIKDLEEYIRDQDKVLDRQKDKAPPWNTIFEVVDLHIPETCSDRFERLGKIAKQLDIAQNNTDARLKSLENFERHDCQEMLKRIQALEESDGKGETQEEQTDDCGACVHIMTPVDRHPCRKCSRYNPLDSRDYFEKR